MYSKEERRQKFCPRFAESGVKLLTSKESILDTKVWRACF